MSHPASLRHDSLPAAAAWTEIEQLQHEKDALGLYWSGHPVDRYAEALREYGAKSTADLNLRKTVGEDDPVAITGSPHGTGNGNGAGGARTAEDVSIAASFRPRPLRRARAIGFVITWTTRREA